MNCTVFIIRTFMLNLDFLLFMGILYLLQMVQILISPPQKKRWNDTGLPAEKYKTTGADRAWMYL